MPAGMKKLHHKYLNTWYGSIYPSGQNLVFENAQE